MLSNMISRVANTSVKTTSRYVEISSNSSNSDISNEKNADEPPLPDNNSSSIGQNSNHNNSSNNNNNKHRFHNKCESLDEGTFAFMCWMNSENKKSITSDNPIVLLKFVNDKHTILYDTDLHSKVDVHIEKGVPYCRYCKLDDCSHVGFAVCIEQLYGHRRVRGGKEETVNDIISDD
jgi:hypothetical protein